MATVSDPAPLLGLLDDASALSPAPRNLVEASTGGFDSPAVGCLVVPDTSLPLLRGSTVPLAVEVTGGAGQVAGPVALAARLGLAVTRVHVALRDPGDLAGNARRVGAAVADVRDSGALSGEVVVVLPAEVPPAMWAAAADEVAGLGLLLGLTVSGASPATTLDRLDGALDRETPFVLTDAPRLLTAPGDAVPGLLNVLVAAGRLFDGLDGPDVALLETGPDRLLDQGAEVGLARCRRWCTSGMTRDPEGWSAAMASLGLLDHTTD